MATGKTGKVLVVDDETDVLFALKMLLKTEVKEVVTEKNPDNLLSLLSKEKFDVIIVDSSEPIGPATPLFNVDFYKDVAQCLTDDGIVVSQGESPYYDMKMQKVLVKILAEVFPKVHIYNYCNMSYPSGLWSFTYASKGICPIKDFDSARVKEKHQYYNSELHKGAFLIPQFMKDEHGESLTSLPPLKWS